MRVIVDPRIAADLTGGALPAPRRERHALVLVLATGLLAATAAMQAVPGALGPVLQSDLHIGAGTIGLLSAAAFGGMAAGMLPGGMLTDRFGERLIMSIGVGGAGVVMMVGSLASSANLLLVAFLAASLGTAFGATGGPKTVVRWFAPNRRGTAMGIRQTGVPLGGLLASLILPTVAVVMGWRVALRGAAAVAIVAAVVFYVLYRVPRSIRPPAASRLADRIFLGRPFLAATACAFILQAAQGCALTYVSLDMHASLGLPATVSALYLALVQVGGVVGRIAWGAAADAAGSGRSLTWLCLGGAACCGAMSALNGGTSVFLAGAMCLGLGLSAMSWNAVYINMVAAMAPDRATGFVLGIGLTVALLGFLLVPVFGHLADIAHSFGPAWIGLAALLAVGAALAYAASRSRIGVGAC